MPSSTIAGSRFSTNASRSALPYALRRSGRLSLICNESPTRSASTGGAGGSGTGLRRRPSSQRRNSGPPSSVEYARDSASSAEGMGMDSVILSTFANSKDACGLSRTACARTFSPSPRSGTARHAWLARPASGPISVRSRASISSSYRGGSGFAAIPASMRSQERARSVALRTVATSSPPVSSTTASGSRTPPEESSSAPPTQSPGRLAASSATDSRWTPEGRGRFIMRRLSPLQRPAHGREQCKYAILQILEVYPSCVLKDVWEDLSRRTDDPLADWARSGLMPLTGHPDGPPLAPSGRTAALARELAHRFTELTSVPLDGARLLSERAAFTGRRRGGRVSVGG